MQIRSAAKGGCEPRTAQHTGAEHVEAHDRRAGARLGWMTVRVITGKL